MTSLRSSRLTHLLDRPEGALEYLVTGSGQPVTVFGHGLAGSIDTTRPFGSGVTGTKVFMHFRGHGASAAPETSPWGYASLARELDDMARHVGATQALGVSMGAGALCHLLEETPDRFERLVLVIPAVLDRPREDAAMQRLLDMGDAVDARDREGLAEFLLAEQPADKREDPAVRHWCEQQARVLVGTPVARALRRLPHDKPMADRRALTRVTAPTLVLAQADDEAHPVWVAEEIAALVPGARLEVLPPGGIMWSHRRHVRDLVGQFLSS